MTMTGPGGDPFSLIALSVPYHRVAVRPLRHTKRCSCEHAHKNTSSIQHEVVVAEAGRGGGGGRSTIRDVFETSGFAWQAQLGQTIISQQAEIRKAVG